MLEGIPRISVLIICYKQEELIKRAINSLLAQKDYIYEICVSDDCSPDRTWEVLQEYDRQYPGLFKLHRNEPNVGIFENIEYTWTMPTGDIIYQLSGDDECGEGWFQTVVEFIQKNNIDYKNELFCIYGDYKAVYPNGDSLTISNKLIKKHSKNHEPLSLYLRGLLSGRSACFSINVLKKFFKVSQGRSHIAETAQDMQLSIFSNTYYYIPIVGNIYYTAIGVSTKINSEDYYERLKIFPYAIKVLDGLNIKLEGKDRRLLEYNIATKHYLKTRSFIDFVNYFRMMILSADFSLGLESFKLKFYMFALLRRLPHSRPLVIR